MKKEVIREDTLPHKAKMKKDEPLDVEMKDVDQEKNKEKKEKSPEETKKDSDLLTLEGNAVMKYFLSSFDSLVFLLFILMKVKLILSLWCSRLDVGHSICRTWPQVGT